MCRRKPPSSEENTPWESFTVNCEPNGPPLALSIQVDPKERFNLIIRRRARLRELAPAVRGSQDAGSCNLALLFFDMSLHLVLVLHCCW